MSKNWFLESHSYQGQIERLASRIEGGFADDWVRQGSVDRPKSKDLADIVYQGEQPLLYIHFHFGIYSEAELLALRPELQFIE